MFDTEAFVGAVLHVTGGPVANHPPHVTTADRAEVIRQLRDIGSHRSLYNLEAKLCDICQVKAAVATCSGTAALDIALRLVGVVPGDRVMVPALSYVSAANAVVRAGAVPQFVDSDPGDWGISVDRIRFFLEEGSVMRRTLPAAIIAVDVLGHPCNLPALCELADKYGIPVIEDSAEALGSVIGDRPCGSWGTVGIMSFNTNKSITGGGGGAILTNNPALGGRALHLATTARVKHRWALEHDEYAWNARMPSLVAALVNAQLSRFPHIWCAKRALASIYREHVGTLPGVAFHGELPQTRSNFWLPAITVPAESHEAVLTRLANAGVMARAVFTPMHLLPMYSEKSWSMPVAEEIYRTAICLPAGLELAERHFK